MRKGETKRVWTPEQKSEIVYKHLDDHISVRTLEKEYTEDSSMICRWGKKYIIENERLKKDTERKKLVQTRYSSPDKTRMRNHRNTKR